MFRERRFQVEANPIHSCLIERQNHGATPESKQLCCASQRAQLTRRLRQDPAGEPRAGLGVGLTLGGRSKKAPVWTTSP